jgi:hypothetical protein
MKRYVRGYNSKKPKEPAEAEVHLSDNVDVEFTKDPEWIMPAREIAESECRILQRMRVHVGTHYCDFSVEELPGNEFAIACKSHP